MQMRRRMLIALNRAQEPVDIFATAQKTLNKNLYVDGSEISENGMLVTDYIAVVPGTDYTMDITAGTTGARTRRFLCYDANKTFVSQLATWNWMNKDQQASATVNMPSTAKFARISAYNADNVSVIGLIP